MSDSTDDGAITYTPEAGGRWRVLPFPGDRLPGTFDQDVYVELLHRYAEAGAPPDGAIRFTLHAFLRSIGRRVDGRTYEQLRAALGRLVHTTIESTGAYYLASTRTSLDGRLTVLSSVGIERRRRTDREQLPLFSTVSASEPGDARVVLSPMIRANIAAGHTVTLSAHLYQSLSSPVARRLYRLLAASVGSRLGVQYGHQGHRAQSGQRGVSENIVWQIGLDRLAGQLPLAQRYPSHLRRVLQPAHEMLVTAGIIRSVRFAASERHIIYFL